jgi:hypothetical protein
MLYDRAPVPDSYYPPAGVEPKAYTDEIVKGHLGRVFKNEIFLALCANSMHDEQTLLRWRQGIGSRSTSSLSLLSNHVTVSHSGTLPQ